MVVKLPIVDSSGQDIEASCLAYGRSVKVQGNLEDSGECQATLRAHCLEERDDVAAVVLPQSTFQNGPRVVVRKTNLVE